MVDFVMIGAYSEEFLEEFNCDDHDISDRCNNYDNCDNCDNYDNSHNLLKYTNQ